LFTYIPRINASVAPTSKEPFPAPRELMLLYNPLASELNMAKGSCDTLSPFN